MINVVELCGGYCQGMHCKSNGFRGKGGYFSVNVRFFLFFLFWFSKEGNALLLLYHQTLVKILDPRFSTWVQVLGPCPMVESSNGGIEGCVLSLRDSVRVGPIWAVHC